MKSEFSIEIQKFISAFQNVTDDLKAQGKRVLITTHRFLDGDAFGSAVAFGLLLQRLGIESTLLCVPFVPQKLKFLGSMGPLKIISPFDAGNGDISDLFADSLSSHLSGKIEEYGALTILDCAGIDQIPEEAWSIGKDLPYKINIDHHAGYELQSPAGKTLNLVIDCSSTSEIIFGLLKEMNIKEYPEMAVPLFVGMVADLRKNEVSKDSPGFPEGAIRELDFQARKINFDVRRLVKTVFSLDPWERHLLKVTLAGRRSVGDVVYVRFDHEMILQAKEATDSMDNPRMPFHEFHTRLRHRLRRFSMDFAAVVIFDQLLGKVSLYALQEKGGYDLAAISMHIGNGGGHPNRVGFRFSTAKEKLIACRIAEENTPDEMIMRKIVESINQQISEVRRSSHTD